MTDLADLRAENERLRAALKPFVAAFEKRRDAYSRRYQDRDLGYANFDKMPGDWPMGPIDFAMSVFREARSALSSTKPLPSREQTWGEWERKQQAKQK